MARPIQLVSLAVLFLLSHSPARAQLTRSMVAFGESPPQAQQLSSLTGAETLCTSGSAAGYPCSHVDLLSFMDLGSLGSGAANDIWGWTDPVTQHEYALIGLDDGTGFVDVTDPVNPVYVGKLPTHTSSSSWRDIKVYQDHAFVVSEASGHGVQVFDLTQLRSATPNTTFGETAHYSGVSSVHNIIINEDTGFAYTVGNHNGGTTCGSGLHIIDIQDPENPTFAGCFSTDGYTHDAQCVLYSGPDTAHQGKEICVALNEDTITIVDVTNKAAPSQLSRLGYPGAAYVHQGWFSEDQAYFYQDDELDSGNTRTIIWDLADLTDPVVATNYYSALSTKDHNQYVVGDLLYQTNYTAGLRILDISSPLQPVEIGYFDTYKPNDGTSYNGTWSNYPFFASGTIVVSSIGEGLFVLRYNPDAPPPPPAATEMYVDDVVLVTQGGRKRQKGVAVVSVLDDLGNPVAGAVVSGQFSGSFDEIGSGTTDAGGQATIVTGQQAQNPIFDFCVDDVTGSLPYNASANSDPAFACGTTGGGTPTSVHVAYIQTGQQGVGQGEKVGTADVTIVDDLGSPVGGALVDGTFGGDFSESVSATTSSSGIASFSTSTQGRGSLNVSFCVNDVTATLPYDSGNNASAAYACTAPKNGAPAAASVQPTAFQLGQNYPNPFNPSTVISFDLAEPGHVSLKVFDMLGKEIRVLASGFLEAGRYRVVFDASDLPAGHYVYSIRSGEHEATRTMTLLK